jgi:hypothetical protein
MFLTFWTPETREFVYLFGCKPVKCNQSGFCACEGEGCVLLVHPVVLPDFAIFWDLKFVCQGNLSGAKLGLIDVRWIPPV